MRAKSALWAMSLALFVVAGSPGNCFGQSDLAIAPEAGYGTTAVKSPKPFTIDNVSPTFTAPLISQSDIAVSAGGDSSMESSEPAPKSANKTGFSKIGIGIKISTLGAGVEVATPLAGKLNLRGGFNIFRYSTSITNNGIVYDGSLHFQSAEAHLDWFPIGGFHISPGLLFYNGNNLSGAASVPGGQNFSLGSTQYESDPAAPVTGTGKLDFVKVAPSIMVGIGNLIPRNGRHFSFLAEIGGAYQGSARVNLNLTGNVCDTTGTVCRSISSDPTVQANIVAQQQKIQKDVNPYRFFPVVSVGFGFNF